jgi:hypothetical protein
MRGYPRNREEGKKLKLSLDPQILFRIMRKEIEKGFENKVNVMKKILSSSLSLSSCYLTNGLGGVCLTS